MNALEKMWKRIRSWADANAKQYQVVSFTSPDAKAVRPQQDYFRVWLNEMFLTERRDWFQSWYPAVNSSIQLKFGSRPSPITLSHIAEAPQKALAEAVLLDFPVTDLLPFRGGVVEMEAALVGLKGDNSLGAVIGVLQSFSGLVGAPLVQALDVAGKVAAGIDQLLGATNGVVHLGFHRGYMSEGGGDAANVLKEGYIAVLLATPQEIAKDRLKLEDNRLLYSPKPGAAAEPLTGYDYMTFRIERREERDDWRLSTIEEPMNKAIEAILMGKESEAKTFKQHALIAAYQSDDLSLIDRRRVVKAIKDELSVIEDEGLGAVGDKVRDLETIRQTRAMPLAVAAAQGEISLDEVLAE